MQAVFQISGDEIAQLDDADLRELVGRLCEADYRKAGLSLKGIFWGGHQDASDGGFDVNVDDAEVSPPQASFVTAPRTGFQVKKPKMPASAIKNEMLKNGVLKSEIAALLRAGGAYIIVSSGDSTTRGRALENRLSAMSDAIATSDGIDSPKIDFLDRGRLATWLGQHPALVIWVRERLAKSLFGWKPYGNWAKTLTGKNDLFLIGEDTRLGFNSDTLEMEEGIREMRTKLSEPQSALRLIGLSGVGKTRLVQALFDERVGELAIDPTLAIYADVSDSLTPDPKHLAHELVARGDRVILVVDNCSRDLHRSLAEEATAERSALSLITIEYDVREDLPEETSVFRLEPTTDDLLKTLLEREFPLLGHTNAESISRVSGGNFRVAIYLAKTVHGGESIGVLTDESLFKRLFQQGHEHNEDLLESAETLSLLYSFDGSDLSEQSEMKMLARVADKPVNALYRDSQKIAERELIQKRGEWRAVLPHAVSNSLAKSALRRISPSVIQDNILKQGSERTIISFSRRLGYLHDSDEAKSMVTLMLEKDGWLGGSLNNLSSFGFRVLSNLSPVAPDAVLNGLERIAQSKDSSVFFSKKAAHAHGFTKILSKIAYEDCYFIRAVRLLSLFALTESPSVNVDSIRDRLKALFHVYLSGSHAKATTRQSFLRELFESDELSRALGFELLQSALKTSHFMGTHGYDFGAHPRDYGNTPKTRVELESWFRPFIGIGLAEGLKSSPDAYKALSVLADSFRGLCRMGFLSDFEKCVDAVLEHSSWVDAWRVVQSVFYYDGDSINQEIEGRFKILESRLKPKSLKDRIEYYVSTKRPHIFDADDDDRKFLKPSEAYHYAEEVSEKLGIELAQDEGLFRKIVNDYVQGEQGRFFELGKGLAQSQRNLSQSWKILRKAIQEVPEKQRNVGLLRGFVWKLAEVDGDLYEAALDDVMEDSTLIPWAVDFFRSSRFNARALARLDRLLDEKLVPVWAFRQLAYGRRHEHICDEALIGLLEKILAKENGQEVVLSILGMRFHGLENELEKIGEEMKTFTRKFLGGLSFAQDSDDCRDYDLAGVIGVAFQDGIFESEAEELLDKMIPKDGFGVFFGDFDRSLKRIAKTQPLALLNSWFGDEDRSGQLQRNFRREELHSPTILSKIDEELFFEWADRAPEVRYPRLAWHIQMIEKKGSDGSEWSALTTRFLERSPSFSAVLEVFMARLHPTGWSGSLGALLEERASLLEALPVKEENRNRLKERVAELRDIAEEELANEATENRREYQSFE